MCRRTCFAGRCCRTRSCARPSDGRGRCSTRRASSATCGRCPPTCGICAPWLAPTRSRRCSARTPHAWTVSDLPFLDAARQRIGDPAASATPARRDAALAAEHERQGPGRRRPDRGRRLGDAASCRCCAGRTPRTRSSTRRTAQRRPDLLAGPFAHIVVDEAQELTDAEWQMLLLRCPSRSFTVVGDRAQARHGFTESWQERLERIGLDRIDLATLTINYRTPAEIMAEAEPVIRAVLPDANVPTSVRSSGIPVEHGAASRAGSILGRWLAAHAEGIACVIGDRRRSSRRIERRPRAVADPGAVEGTRVRPGGADRAGGVRHAASRARSTAMSR